jgi:hypothetical protein
MKTLLPPAFAVFASTAGTYAGCRFCGMPPGDLKLATLLAFGASLLVAFGAVLVADRRRANPNRFGTSTHS